MRNIKMFIRLHEEICSSHIENYDSFTRVTMSRYVLTCNSEYVLSSHLPSKNIKIKVYRTIILLSVLHRFETFPATLREGAHRLIVFRNTVLRE
jgi:hypothetical protein